MPDTSGGNGGAPVSVNVLVAEESLQAIADAIRAKNGTHNTYMPGEMATAIRAISGGGESSVLGSKTITVNGTFNASTDGFDGYSSVTTDVHVGILEPYFENLTTGYVDAGVWTLGGTNCFSDVYEVEADTIYLISLGATVGTRFRVMFCTTDPTTTAENITGTQIVILNNPAPYTYRIYTPSEDGYFIIQKDNAGASNLKTYVFGLHDLVDGNSLISGGGGEAALQLLTATTNGTYTPTTGYDGFSQVTVAVPASTLVQKIVTANGTYDAADDNADGFSQVTVAVPGSTLVQKNITSNGTFTPSTDNADGYSGLTVDVRPGLMTPMAFDLATGYVYNGSWMLGGSTVNYSDVYEVEAGKKYLISLGATVGSRFRSLFTEQNTVDATATITGTTVSNVSGPAAFATATYTPSTDGYLTITKDNAGLANIKTYVYDLEALLNGDTVQA